MPAPKDDAPKAKAEKKPQEYRVAHTKVDDWSEGDRLTEKDLDGLDIQRLVDVGAIVPADAPDEDEEEPVEPPEPPAKPPAAPPAH